MLSPPKILAFPPESEAYPEFFFGGGGGGEADSQAIKNVCLILKTMLWKSCQILQADI
jgi:hypothetical protein